ncbi:MAG: hypothetical protein ABR928_21820 [Terracidiphilus sp.]|jgi:hypothetical protein
MKGDTKYELFSKEPGKFSKDVYERVSKIAEELKAHMDTKSFRSKLELVHKVNGKSQDVQKLIADELVRLKFMPEKRGLFSECEVPSLRPDLYLQLGKSGILVEVERGKTTANNMDFLDVWKCHICAHADFLFLIVPCERARTTGKPTKEFERVKNRIGTFFKRGNYVNVEEVHLFGY